MTPANSPARAVAAVLIAAAASAAPGPTPSPAGRPLRDVTFPRTPERIERGRYLAEGLLKFEEEPEPVLAVGAVRFASRRLADILTCERDAERRPTALYSLSYDERARPVE